MNTTTPKKNKTVARPKPGTLRHLYLCGGTFHRVSVLQGQRGRHPWVRSTWLVIGPGLLWLGQEFNDYNEAVRFAHLHASRLGEGYWSRKYADVLQSSARVVGKVTPWATTDRS